MSAKEILNVINEHMPKTTAMIREGTPATPDDRVTGPEYVAYTPAHYWRRDEDLRVSAITQNMDDVWYGGVTWRLAEFLKDNPREYDHRDGCMVLVPRSVDQYVDAMKRYGKAVRMVDGIKRIAIIHRDDLLMTPIEMKAEINGDGVDISMNVGFVWADEVNTP